MRTAVQDLNLEHLWVVYPGSRRYPVDAPGPSGTLNP